MVKVYVRTVHRLTNRRLSPTVPRVYERPTAIERPRTIPHTGHWGHITLPTYIQSLLIYIYYSLAPLFIVFHGDARRTGTLICTNWKLWSATKDKSHRRRRGSDSARELFDAGRRLVVFSIVLPFLSRSHRLNLLWLLIGRSFVAIYTRYYCHSFDPSPREKGEDAIELRSYRRHWGSIDPHGARFFFDIVKELRGDFS